MTAAHLRQWWTDLLAQFWLRPAVMTLAAIVLAQALVEVEGRLILPGWLDHWVYARGAGGARDVLGVVASAMIGVAGTTFSITVAALTLASSQMGPRLLRNFTRDPGNQTALGALVATFAYALVVLRSVHDAEDAAFVPQLAVSVALLLAFACAGVLIWFLHHVATSISVDRVVALVADDLVDALCALAQPTNEAGTPASAPPEGSAKLLAPGDGYLRVLDDDSLADWAAERDAVLWLRVRPGDFVFPGSVVGQVAPAALAEAAQAALASALSFGTARSAEQDPEFLVRQLVEIALRALSPGINDPFTAIGVLDRLAAALCLLAGRVLPTGMASRDGRLRVSRPATDYPGLVDTMFHMLRQAAATQPSVIIRLLEVLGEVAAVEPDADRRAALRRQGELARATGLGGTLDAAARDALMERHDSLLRHLDGTL